MMSLKACTFFRARPDGALLLVFVGFLFDDWLQTTTVRYTKYIETDMQSKSDYFFSRKVEALLVSNTQGEEWADNFRFVQERVSWASAPLICAMLNLHNNRRDNVVRILLDQSRRKRRAGRGHRGRSSNGRHYSGYSPNRYESRNEQASNEYAASTGRNPSPPQVQTP